MDPTDHNNRPEINGKSDIDHPPDDPDMVSLARYLSGECTAHEAAIVNAWIASDASRQVLARQAGSIWAEASKPSMEWDIDRVWQRIQYKRTGSSPKAKTAQGWQQGRLYLGALAIAMSAVIAVGIISFQDRSSAPELMAEEGMEGSGRVFATRRGQRSVVKLPDGAEITLAADSRIRVPESYGGAHRILYLEGTAQFSVQHDPKKPFIVHTRFGEVRDLATVFVVSAYDSDTVQRVIVKEGRVASVASRGDRAQVILNPGDMGIISYSGASAVQHDADISAHTAWVSGELRFDNTPLGEVVMELERWYDVTLRIDDSQLARTPITVSLGKGTIDDALSVIEKILNIKSQRHESHIRLVKESLNEI